MVGENKIGLWNLLNYKKLSMILFDLFLMAANRPQAHLNRQYISADCAACWTTVELSHAVGLYYPTHGHEMVIKLGENVSTWHLFSRATTSRRAVKESNIRHLRIGDKNRHREAIKVIKGLHDNQCPRYIKQATIINGTDQNPSFPCPMIQPLLSDCAI